MDIQSRITINPAVRLDTRNIEAAGELRDIWLRGVEGSAAP
jgi:hypothetical protein